MLLRQRVLSKDERLVVMLLKNVIAMAALEKQAAAIEDLCGTLSEPVRPCNPQKRLHANSVMQDQGDECRHENLMQVL